MIVEKKKYIIELPENTHGIQWIMESTKDHHPYMDYKQVEDLIPYTEDSAYAHGYTEAESKYREIRDELEKQAYQRGYEEAYDTAYADAEGIYESGKRAMYQKGLKDAWEAARKIASDNAGRNYAIFGQHFTVEILNTHSASECIEKIRAYEQEKEEQIQVGDEVINTQTDARFIVTHMWVNNSGEKGVSGFNYGCSAFSTTLDLIRKSGRHFPEIAKVLQKMKEAQ